MWQFFLQKSEDEKGEERAAKKITGEALKL